MVPRLDLSCGACGAAGPGWVNFSLVIVLRAGEKLTQQGYEGLVLADSRPVEGVARGLRGRRVSFSHLPDC